MNRHWSALFVGALSAGAFFALSSCGDGTTSGVSNNKNISDLSEQEAYKLCVGFCEDMRVPSQEAACLIGSLATSLGVSSICENLYDACMDLPVGSCEDECSMDDDGQGDDEWDEDEDDDDFEECDPKVGEVSVCFDAVLAVLDDTMSQISCDSNLLELESLLEPLYDTPEACEALEKKCPDMVPDIDFE
jgi:hypothetical protein